MIRRFDGSHFASADGEMRSEEDEEVDEEDDMFRATEGKVVPRGRIERVRCRGLE